MLDWLALDVSAPPPKIRGKGRTRSDQGYTKLCRVPERRSRIAYQIVKDDGNEEIVTGME
jgi:hypothetical protein